MAEEQQRIKINSVADFLAACESTEPVFMDGGAYREIISFLMEQARTTNDTNTRQAIEKFIADFAEPVTAYNPEEHEEKGQADLVDLGGVVKLSKNLRGQLLQAIEKGNPEELDALRSIIPQTAIINISKLANEITNNFANEGIFPVVVSKRTAKKEVSIIASMTTEDPNIQITGRQPYTAYDRAVLNGICSLWQAGNTSFTAAMVYRAMNGMSGTEDGGARVSPQAVGAVTKSIEKQRTTRLIIDCTEQMQHYPGLKKAKFDAMMLSVDGVEMTAQNGAKVKAYSFTNPKRPPVLYEYSSSIKQVLSVSPQLLNSSATIRTTEEIIVIRELLIRRIEGMRGGNSLQSNRITYAAIYRELGIDPDKLAGDAKKNTPRRVRKNTAAILEHFHKEGYISGFSDYKKGKTVEGVEISL